MKKIFLILAVSSLAVLLLASCTILREDGAMSTVSTVDHILDFETVDDAPAESETDEPTEDITVVPTEAPTEEPETTPSETTATPVVTPVGSYRPKALMYHLILEEPYSVYDALFVRPAEFDSHLSYMNSLGYEYLFAEDWRITERPSVMLTFDDGYLDNYTEMFPLIKKHGAKATVFLVTDLIGTSGYMTEAQIKEMSESGLVSFQCHTAHHNDLSYRTAEELRADFAESVSRIEEITGKPVKALAYPAGSYNDTVIEIASEFFDFAYTTKSPVSVHEYSSLTVPRYYMARGMAQGTVESYLSY